MATRALNLTRSILTTKQTLSLALSRSYTTLSLSTPPPSSTFSLFRLRPLFAAAASLRHASSSVASLRGFATRQTTSSLKDSISNLSTRIRHPILLDGCDFEHWLVVMEKPKGDPARDDIIDSYIKKLAQVVGSEDEARMKIYSVSTKHYFAFGALVSEEVSYKINGLPKVVCTLPDSYSDVRNKVYGGEPFINGQAVPYDPKYHEEWVRNNARANQRIRRDVRLPNFDSSRNFERRGENMQQNYGPNTGGPLQGNMGGARNASPPPQGGPPRPNYMGGAPPPNYGGAPPNPSSMQHVGPPPNYGNMGGGPNDGGMPYQQDPGYQNAPPPNMAGGNPYQTQTQNMPGRENY